MPDRVVRFAEEFFRELDALLGPERSAEGAPSSTDFLLHELPRLRDRLAEDFEGNTMPAVGAEPTRVLVSRGVMVASVALYAAVALDGDVVVFAIDLDRWPRSERRRSRRGVDDHVWARAVR